MVKYVSSDDECIQSVSNGCAVGSTPAHRLVKQLVTMDRRFSKAAFEAPSFNTAVPFPSRKASSHSVEQIYLHLHTARSCSSTASLPSRRYFRHSAFQPRSVPSSLLSGSGLVYFRTQSLSLLGSPNQTPKFPPKLLTKARVNP
jgi:hypothetical protein